MKKENSRRGLFEKAIWSAVLALALSCPAVAADACCGDGDWLLDSSRYKAVVREAGGAWILENGLARREIAVRPGAATTSFKCLATGEELVRGVSAYSIQFGISLNTRKNRSEIEKDVLFSSRCACAKEVVPNWDKDKSCDQNISGHEDAVARRIKTEFDALYSSCVHRVGKPSVLAK